MDDIRVMKLESRLNKLRQNGKNFAGSGVIRKIRRELRNAGVITSEA